MNEFLFAHILAFENTLKLVPLSGCIMHRTKQYHSVTVFFVGHESLALKLH